MTPLKIFQIAVSSTEILKKFLEIANEELSLPNIPFPTMGGEFFWNTIYESNGYRFQQNMITQHARILNEDNIRIAWGTISGMERVFERFCKEYM